MMTEYVALTKMPTNAAVERAMRQSRAAARAATLPAGDYHASGPNVARFDCINGAASTTTVIECESHWDACLVLLARGGEPATIFHRKAGCFENNA